jgi:hypothetical protein
MLDIFGSIASSALGGSASAPVSSYIIHDFRDDRELIETWGGAIYRRYFRWQSGWGDWHEVITAKHPTRQAADVHAREMALSSGYLAPRWFEFWRWGETSLP